MANLRGKDSHKGVSLIVEEVNKNDKGSILNVQIDQSLKNVDKLRSGEKKADSNPYIYTGTSTYQNSKGKEVEAVQHTQFYSKSQVDKIMENAKVAENNGKTFYGIKADLIVAKGENSLGKLVINTQNDIEPTQNKYFGKDTLAKQHEVTKVAKEVREARLNEKAREATAEKEAVAEKEESVEKDI